jgi:DNA-binding MarR family transcriptional regulator
MSVKRCVDDLEKRDLVKSTAAPDDRRPRVLNATRSGRDLAREIDRRVRLHEASLRDVLGSANYETLMAILSRLEQHLELDSAPVGVTETRSER